MFLIFYCKKIYTFYLRFNIFMNMKIKQIILFSLLITILIGCNKKEASKTPDLSLKKAVVISGNYAIEWQKRGTKHIEHVLKQNKVQILAVLDVAGKKENVVPILKKAISLKPDVICIYQNSLIASTLMKNIKKFRDLSIPIVMANMFFKKKIHPKITGISFTSGVKPIFNIWKKILPHAKKVSIIASDNPFSNELVTQYKKYSTNLGYTIIRIYRPKYGYEWKDAIEKINKDKSDFVLIGFWIGLKMRNGEPQTNREFDNVKYWTVRNITKGYASFFNVVVLYGVTFGVCKDLVQDGVIIGEKAIEILKSKNVDDMPVTDSPFLYLAINKRHADMIKLKIPYDVLSNAKYIHKNFLGEYKDDYFKKQSGGIPQPKRKTGWKWIPK